MTQKMTNHCRASIHKIGSKIITIIILIWLADSDESDNHTTESGATFNIEFLVNKKT